MELFDSTKPILENIYYLSGIIIAVVAFIGLYQIWLLKKGLVISSRRDAAKLSIELSERYEKKFEGCIDLLVEGFIDGGCEVKLELEIDDFSIEEYNSKFSKEWKKQFKNMDISSLVKFEEVANILNGYAVPILNGIADEETSFHRDVQNYLLLSTMCFPFTIQEFEKNNLEFHHNRKLHILWKNKVTDILLKKELKSLKTKITNYKPGVKINPIGTN